MEYNTMTISEFKYFDQIILDLKGRGQQMIQKTMTNDIGFIATQTINRRHISSRSKK